MSAEPIAPAVADLPERHLHAVPDGGRQPMADIAAEQCVLGALMLSETVADDVLEVLSSDDFYRPAHATIYAVIIGLLARGEPIDPVTMAHTLAATGDLVKVGGAPYLHTLVATVPTAANATYYARIVADKAARRRLTVASVRIAQYAEDLARDVPDAVNAAQAELHSATVRMARSAVQRVGDLVDGCLDEFLSEAGPDRGISTGLGVLDEILGGLKPGQLILPAGRPGSGKSVLCLDLARAAARRGIPVGFWSLEMSKRELMARLFAAECGVMLSNILNGKLWPEDRVKLREQAAEIRSLPIHIDDTAPNDLASIRSTARRLQQRTGLGLIIVDYLGLIRPVRPRPNRNEEVSENSNGLKLLGKELGVPVVAAAQLNRGPEARNDKRPQLSDLRESGSLEQDADVVILLHRPDYYDQECERAGEIDLIVAKHRNGATETVTAAAQLHWARIVDMDVPEERR